MEQEDGGLPLLLPGSGGLCTLQEGPMPQQPVLFGENVR